MKKQFEVVKPTPPTHSDWDWQINTRFNLCHAYDALVNVPGMGSLNLSNSTLPKYDCVFKVAALFTKDEVRKSVLSVLGEHLSAISQTPEPVEQ